MAARTTKKDLESKIALLEKKLQKLTDSVDLQKTSPKPASVKPKGTLPKGTAPKPTPEYVKPKGTLPKTSICTKTCTCTNKTQRLPKGFTPESKPKPAETKNAPTNMAQKHTKMANDSDYQSKDSRYAEGTNKTLTKPFRQHCKICRF